MTYEITLNEMIVTEFNEEYQDWSGETFSKGSGGFISPEVIDELTADNLKEAASMFTGLMADEIEIFINDWNDSYFQVSIIENGDALPDDNGRYLVDYIFNIESVERSAPDLSGFPQNF